MSQQTKEKHSYKEKLFKSFPTKNKLSNCSCTLIKKFFKSIVDKLLQRKSFASTNCVVLTKNVRLNSPLIQNDCLISVSDW